MIVRHMPRWDGVKGAWKGGAPDTLYAFTDKRTRHVTVRPGRAGAVGIWKFIGGVGPEVTVRIATREEAEALWQDPLHPGWRVQETPRSRR